MFQMANHRGGLNRRDLLRIWAMGAIAVPQVGLLAGCSDRSPYSDAQKQMDLLTRLSELVLPATDTPGAGSPNVTKFLQMAIGGSAHSVHPKMIADIGAWLDQAGDESFLAQSPRKQAESLSTLDQITFNLDVGSSIAAQHAWASLKPLIVAGYYSSEAGASVELIYEPVPGRFENITISSDYIARSNEGHGEKW